MVLPGTLFEEMGFNYIGPIDGHDLQALVRDAAQHARRCSGPQLLHVVTRKGKGYAPAEADPITWHGPGPFDPASGTIFKEKRSDADLLAGLRPVAVRHGRARPAHHRHHAGDARRLGHGRILASAFRSATSMSAIAEQHAVTFAAGLACEGCKPVVAIYSTFLQRAYDQLIHDVALQNLPVVFAIDRAGLVGSDGATHQGSYDLSLHALHPEHGRSWRRRMKTSAARCSTPPPRSTVRRRCATRAAAGPGVRDRKLR